ncbi:MAG: tRNA (guanosine(46)-N7)-methyltransferase TrmB [Sphaerochaetaceae bacterium]
MKEHLKRVESREIGTRQKIKSFVLRQSRLKPAQLEALEKYSAEYVVPFGQTPLNFEDLFNNSNRVVLEIGFGMGDATLKIAQTMAQTNFLALEVYLNGFAKLLAKIGSLNLTNIKLIRFDAVEVLENMVSNHSLAGFHIFFPDPWPKKRHHKRRLMQPEFIELLCSKLAVGGYIYFITDWQEYADEVLALFAQNERLVNPYKGYAPRQSWRAVTGFERKGVAQGHCIYEIWVEKSRV